MGCSLSSPEGAVGSVVWGSWAGEPEGGVSWLRVTVSHAPASRGPAPLGRLARMMGWALPRAPPSSQCQPPSVLPLWLACSYLILPHWYVLEASSPFLRTWGWLLRSPPPIPTGRVGVGRGWVQPAEEPDDFLPSPGAHHSFLPQAGGQALRRGRRGAGGQVGLGTGSTLVAGAPDSSLGPGLTNLGSRVFQSQR